MFCLGSRVRGIVGLFAQKRGRRPLHKFWPLCHGKHQNLLSTVPWQNEFGRSKTAPGNALNRTRSVYDRTCLCTSTHGEVEAVGVLPVDRVLDPVRPRDENNVHLENGQLHPVTKNCSSKYQDPTKNLERLWWIQGVGDRPVPCDPIQDPPTVSNPGSTRFFWFCQSQHEPGFREDWGARERTGSRKERADELTWCLLGKVRFSTPMHCADSSHLGAPSLWCPVEPAAGCPLERDVWCPLEDGAGCPLECEFGCPADPDLACPVGPGAGLQETTTSSYILSSPVLSVQLGCSGSFC